MKCKVCGLENLEEAKFCSGCGEALVEEPVEVVEEVAKPHVPKCFDVFAKLGFGLGLGGLIASILCGIGMAATIPGIVFSILGKRSIDYRAKANKGLVLSIIGTVASFIIYIVTIVVMALIELALAEGYY